NLALAYSMLKAGAAAFAVAGFLIGRGDPPAADQAQDVFAARMIALSSALDGGSATVRATRLLEAFTGHVAAARALLSAPAQADPQDPDGPGQDDGDGADLLEAAGIAYTLGQMLESPPGPREGPPGGPTRR
ncbi:MAG TPA: hypothetical protein VHT25_01320, partial [Solirubrobacteraceae bacterium]|nr:hypothetical protein [Solirubrobacteraceae bacterium]